MYKYEQQFSISCIVVDLLRGMTLQDVSNHLGVSWDTVKEIHSTYLERHYSLPSLEGVENIDIDEFAVRKGHVYKTKRKVLKGTRFLLLGNGTDVFDKQHKSRLDNALAMNEPLSKAYYMKEQLRPIWMQPTKSMGEDVFDDWVRQAEESMCHTIDDKKVSPVVAFYQIMLKIQLIQHFAALK